MNIINLKKLILSGSALSAIALSSQAATLRVAVEGITEPIGKVMITLFNSEGDWLTNGMQQQCVVTSSGPQVLVFENVVPGTYALYALHDTDNDGKMRTGAFGKPEEPYGFSNNARGLFGPAKWKDACFEVGNEELSVSFKVK